MDKQDWMKLVITLGLVSALIIYSRGEFREFSSLNRLKHGHSPSNLPLIAAVYRNRSIVFHSQAEDNSSWNVREMNRLSTLIQLRLHSLQNPPDCTKARKIVCDLSRKCGFGCQTHHLSFCMIVAYGTGRTLILKSKNWIYAKEGWETFFQPLSETCRDAEGETIGVWTTPDKNEIFQVLKLPFVTNIHRTLRPDFLPMAIPEDIADELRKVTNNPGIWWIGEILTYITRLQNHTKDAIGKTMADLGYTHPIVGIHIRRTDKLIREAKFHDISEYMAYADKFYKEYEKKKGGKVERKIFLATDHVGLLDEAKKRYADYMFLSESNNTQSARIATRYTVDSLKGIIIDTHLLALSDFLVCTFSSNICRLAYEMMHHYHVNTSGKAISLDRKYAWTGQTPKSSGKTAKMPLYTTI